MGKKKDQRAKHRREVPPMNPADRPRTTHATNDMVSSSCCLRVPGYSTGSQEWSGSKRVIVNLALPGTGAISF